MKFKIFQAVRLLIPLKDTINIFWVKENLAWLLVNLVFEKTVNASLIRLLELNMNFTM